MVTIKCTISSDRLYNYKFVCIHYSVLIYMILNMAYRRCGYTIINNNNNNNWIRNPNI